MVDPTPTPAPASTAPVASDSQPAAPSSGPDTTGLSSEVRQALQDAYPRDAVETPPVPSAPAAEPATEVVPEAAQEPEPEGDDEPEQPATVAETPGEPKLSRAQREAARRQAEVDQAVAAALAAREQAAQAQAALAARTAEEQRVMAQAAELMGGSAEDENALIDAVANGDFEAADRLKLLRKQKADSAVLATAFDRMAWGKVYVEIQGAREIKGVDPQFMDRVGSLRDVWRHVESAVEARVSADYEGRLERQKADYESRLGRAASGMPTTETGGRAVGTPSQITQADLDRMLANGDWQAYERLTPQQKAQIR